MELRARLLDLLAPLPVGGELIPSVVLEDASSELGLRLRFATPSGRLWVDVTPVADARRYAARSGSFAFGYRTEGGRSSVDPSLGKRVCEAVAARSQTNERRVLAALQRERSDGREARIREVEVTSLLELAGPTAAESFYTLSPYVGCTIGCRFCYAQANVGALRRLLGLREAPWGSYVDARVNAPTVLASELAALTPRPIKFCPVVSDPYQAIERKLRVTRGCLAAIAAAPRPWPAMLLTRSTLILDDLERIAALPLRSVGVSLPTIDDEVRRHFEPRAASVPERLEILRRFRAAGVPTHAIVQPLLAGSLDGLAEALIECTDSVSIDVLRGVEGAESDFADPRFAPTADDGWQLERALSLRDRLLAAGVAVWRGELPPMLARWQPEPQAPNQTQT